MRFAVCIVFALLLLVAQNLFFHLGIPAWATPQGLLVCVVFLAFYEFSVTGGVVAFILGLLLDMSSGIVLGPWAGSYTLLYTLLAFISQRLFVESRLVAMVVVAGSTFLAGGAFLALAYEYQVISKDDVITLLGQGMTSALVTAPIFAAMSRVWKRVGPHGAHTSSMISAL
jgi:rod shape-determining protein MreD